MTVSHNTPSPAILTAWPPPASPAPQLGPERAALLFAITERAGERSLYLVGGVVRDWLLGHPDGGHSEHELDLMLAGPSLGDAIAFARRIQAELGGELREHARFGTAQWLAPSGIAVDFANARRERYPRPGQLPQPRPGTAEEDLWRRDFSINALALQLSPPAAFGQLLDPCGGQADLQQRLLRALHPASFRDDPTRFLRGLRLAARLGLRWEEETARWAQESLPILAPPQRQPPARRIRAALPRAAPGRRAHGAGSG